MQMTYAGAADTTPSGTTRPCNVIADLLGTASTSIAFSQTAELNVPDLTTAKPADATDAAGLDFEGSAAPMDADRMLQLLAHYLNTTTEPDDASSTVGSWLSNTGAAAKNRLP